MHILHGGNAILVIAASQNFRHVIHNGWFLPEHLFVLKILPPRNFQCYGGTFGYRLFFAYKALNKKFLSMVFLFHNSIF